MHYVHTCRSNADAAPSVLLALVGVASIPDVIGQKTSHVTSIHQSGEWSQETLLMELMECMTAILHGTHPKSDHSAFTNLVQVREELSITLGNCCILLEIIYL